MAKVNYNRLWDFRKDLLLESGMMLDEELIKEEMTIINKNSASLIFGVFL